MKSYFLSVMVAFIVFCSSDLGSASLAYGNDSADASIQGETDWPNPLNAPFVPPCLSLDPEESRFLERINDYRVQNGLHPLYVSIRLTDAARWLSEEMGFSHWDSLGRSYAQRISDFGFQLMYFRGTVIGENIFGGSEGLTQSGDQAFTAWQGSSPHKKNMLNKKYWNIGIGRHCDGSNCNWTADFGGNKSFRLTDNCL